MTTTQLAGLLPELEVIRADFPILDRSVAGGLAPQPAVTALTYLS